MEALAAGGGVARGGVASSSAARGGDVARGRDAPCGCSADHALWPLVR
jgi:hypothetical protein